MSIGLIAPVLLSMKMTTTSDFTRDLQIAYGSFGIAWRLLDDIRDIGDDIEKGTESSIYLCLPEKVRAHWKNGILRNRVTAKAAAQSILVSVLEHRIIESIKERICGELETAAILVEAHDLTGLAREFRCLAHPLRNSRTR